MTVPELSVRSSEPTAPYTERNATVSFCATVSSNWVSKQAWTRLCGPYALVILDAAVRSLLTIIGCQHTDSLCEGARGEAEWLHGPRLQQAGARQSGSKRTSGANSPASATVA